jgi:hypothetical protein
MAAFGLFVPFRQRGQGLLGGSPADCKPSNKLFWSDSTWNNARSANRAETSF